ncbi:MAG: hypothetical protein ACRDA4_03930 [Filifactoraceae bacterium]
MDEKKDITKKNVNDMNDAVLIKKKLASDFLKKGITVAIISGMCYGLYSAFVTVAMGEGIWASWYGESTTLSAFAGIYILGALGSAINDSMSAVWAWIFGGVNGKIGDFFRCIKSKPGMIMMIAAIVGGPIAGTAYIVALQMAGPIIIPITALCPAIGAILGRLIFKQQLNARMMFGVVICVLASVIIGSTSMVTGEINEKMVIGMLIALVAAFGWGLEGVIGGYGTSLIDVEIGIMIRQTTSGLVNLMILVPVLSLIDGDISTATSLIVGAFTSGPAMLYFVVSGFFALFAFSLWYKGNSMCGAALGMACNGAYSFWGPFFCWIIIGIIMGRNGFSIAGRAWFAAIVMIVGIILIAMNPMDLLKNKEDK